MAMNLAEMNQQMVSSRVPPAWSPEGERTYSFQKYRQDVELWSAATDMEVARQGPAVALRLGGEAKRLALAIGTQELINGRIIQDGNGNPVQETGLALLIRMLARSYAALLQEEQLHSISQLMGFRRRQNESTDECVSRFELERHHADQAGGIILPVPVASWLLLSSLGIPRHAWPMLLAATAGSLPDDQAQYNAMQQYVRRQGHLTDRNIDPVKQLGYFTGDGVPDSAGGSPNDNSDWFQSNDGGWYQTYESGAPTAETDDDSSCASQTGPLDFSDLEGMTDDNLIGEALYLSYAFAKRRWRAFTGRKGKGKGKGKRKGQHQGKGKPNIFAKRSFMTEPEQTSPDASYSSSEEQHSYKGSGKGVKHGKGATRGNPIGRDGKQLTCRTCNSTEHFAHQCPRNAASSSSGKSGPSTFLADISATSENGYLAAAHYFQGSSSPVSRASGSFLDFADGTSEQLGSMPENEAFMPKPSFRGSLISLASHPADTRPIKKPFYFTSSLGIINFMWFQPDASNSYHTSVRLKQGEGLLVDCGAISNLCGDKWATRVVQSALSAGHGSKYSTLKRPIDIGGVGKHNQLASTQVAVPVAFESGDRSIFKAPIVPDSELPALLGLEMMEQHCMIVDVKNQRLIVPGPNGYRMSLSPGSKSFVLKKAMSGHLLLPCTAWSAQTSSSQQILLMKDE